jgi:hypothetical protein
LYVPIINGRKYSYQYHEILAKLQQKKLHTDHEGEIAKKKQHPQDSARIQVPSDPKKKNLALKNKATNMQTSMWKENKNSEKHTLSY